MGPLPLNRGTDGRGACRLSSRPTQHRHTLAEPGANNPHRPFHDGRTDFILQSISGPASRGASINTRPGSLARVWVRASTGGRKELERNALRHRPPTLRSSNAPPEHPLPARRLLLKIRKHSVRRALCSLLSPLASAPAPPLHKRWPPCQCSPGEAVSVRRALPIDDWPPESTLHAQGTPVSQETTT